MANLSKDDFKILIKGLRAAYPNEKSFNESSAQVWYIHLQDIPYEILQAAIHIHIQRCKWFPSISEIRAICAQMVRKDKELTELEAWALVKKAASNSLYHADEEFEKLPQIIQKVIGSPENLKDWGMMDIDGLDRVGQSNFIRNYRTILARDKEEAQISPEIIARIESINQTMIETYVQEEKRCI